MQLDTQKKARRLKDRKQSSITNRDRSRNQLAYGALRLELGLPGDGCSSFQPQTGALSAHSSLVACVHGAPAGASAKSPTKNCEQWGPRTIAPPQREVAFLEELWAAFTAARNRLWATGSDEDKRATAAAFTAFFLAFEVDADHIAMLAQRWEV